MPQHKVRWFKYKLSVEKCRAWKLHIQQELKRLAVNNRDEWRLRFKDLKAFSTSSKKDMGIGLHS